jgi:hypothetical protein
LGFRVSPSVALASRGPLNARLATGVGLSFFLSFFRGCVGAAAAAHAQDGAAAAAHAQGRATAPGRAQGRAAAPARAQGRTAAAALSIATEPVALATALLGRPQPLWAHCLCSTCVLATHAPHACFKCAPTRLSLTCPNRPLPPLATSARLTACPRRALQLQAPHARTNVPPPCLLRGLQVPDVLPLCCRGHE